MRALLLVLSLLALPSSAAAQNFFLQSGELRAGGAWVGEGALAPVTLVGGRDAAADIGYEGPLVSLRATVDLREAHLQAGVGEDVPLGGVTFATRMLAGTWAPVLGVTSSGVRVALPRGAPAASALLARSPSHAAAPPNGGPWSALPRRPDDDDVALHCRGFSLAPRPGAPATWSPDDALARRSVGTARGWDTVEVQLTGFVVVGYRRHGARCVPPNIRSGYGSTGGSAHCNGVAHARVVVLPAGTELFARLGDATPFATLRAQAWGVEPLDRTPGRRCDGQGRCERVPPLPVGSAPWRVQLHSPTDPASWYLLGFVRAPAESLADAPPGHEGYGLPEPWAPDWPTRPPQK